MSSRKISAVRVTTASFPETVIHSPVPVLVEFSGPEGGLEKAWGALDVSRGDALRVARVDVEECPELPRVFGVGTFPALILFQNGYPLGLLAGETSAGELERWIDGFLVPKPAST